LRPAPTLKVVDLFSGTGSATAEFAKAGHRVVSVELSREFPATLHADVRRVSAVELIELVGGRPDFLWASPPCTGMSTGSFRHHFRAVGSCVRCGDQVVRVGGERWSHLPADLDGEHVPTVRKGSLVQFSPKSATGRLGVELVRRTVELVRELQPRWWMVENPRAMMRNVFPTVARDVGLVGWERRTITHCQYGDVRRMKPTDLFGVFPDGFVARACRNGDRCHVAAPRGARTGTQALSSVEAGMLPPLLGVELLRSCMAELVPVG
jgi:hypothetical protein